MIIISVAYILAFSATFVFVMPVQDAVLPAFGNYASLLFLPHGVRVITAWLYGWRSLLFLAPSAVLTHVYLYGMAGFSLGYMVAMFFGVFCAAFSFWFFALLGLDFRIGSQNKVHWRDVMLAGSASSIVNGLGTMVFFGNHLRTASARLIGNVTGMVVSIFLLMLLFRLLRRVSNITKS
jgi:hypothetical protein